MLTVLGLIFFAMIRQCYETLEYNKEDPDLFPLSPFKKTSLIAGIIIGVFGLTAIIYTFRDSIKTIEYLIFGGLFIAAYLENRINSLEKKIDLLNRRLR